MLLWSNVFAQRISILDNSDLQPISGVKISNSYKNIVLYSNSKGEADITAFADNDSIILSHVSFQAISTLKSKLITKGAKIYLQDNVIKMNEVVISANKVGDAKANIPNKVDVISAKQILFRNPQTAGDMLQQTGNIFVQQSQMGGSSPVIRGFEANKVLMVVDGVRMNNAIYRSGHLQNVITIDPNALENVEIVFGPGSVIYGSDALGGVMSFFTRKPILSDDDKVNFHANAMMRYSSANNEKNVSAGFNIGYKKIAFYTHISVKDLGDLRMGEMRNPLYGDWGKCMFYTQRINGKDSMVKNTDPYLQKNTGYKQYDIMQKVLYKPNENIQFTLNAQYSTSSDVPRYDRLTDIDAKTGLPSTAEWYYGPQQRLLTILKTELFKKYFMYDNATINLAYQNISEDRIQRKFGNNSKEFREETVDIASMNIDMFKQICPKSKLFYGGEFVYNNVLSNAYAKNIVTDKISKNISSRYPDNGSTYQSLAAYITHNWQLNPKLIFSQGIRFSNVQLNSEYTDTMMKIMKFPFDKKISQNNSAVNGSLGLVYTPGYDWKLSAITSTGFRAPNVDDLTKVNDSKGKSRLLVVPNPNLKPEYVINQDLTIGKTFYEKYQVEVTGFYSLINNPIVARPFLFNGEDSVKYDGYLCQVQANVNAKQAFITGMQFNFLGQMNRYVSLTSNLTYTYGRTNDNKPMDHIPPIFGQTSLRIEVKKLKAEFAVRYSRWKKLYDYSASGEDNLQYATAYGTPDWYTLNLRAAYQINKYFNLQLGVENILDDYYRQFASGISAPGRNIYTSLKFNL